jgi:putative acetyltransferase
MQNLEATAQELIIRPEKAKDLLPVRTLLIAAFAQPEEADLVERLRASEYYIPALALVAERKGETCGLCLCTYVHVRSEASEARVLAMGPVAVPPAHQRTGLGSRLIEEAIRVADERGENMIVLLGHESYYPRFGFKRASQFGILPPRPWPDSNYMVLPLKAYDPTVTGTVNYPAEWGI